MREERFSGIRLVVRRGVVQEVTCHGFADRGTGARWMRETPSQIASISKQFVAAVTLMLMADGYVVLEDSVASLLPGSPEQWAEVTVAQLMTHTSGMAHWGNDPGFDPSQRLEPAVHLTHLLAAPLVTTPGRSWRYSSPGYIVLSAVLESAARSPYPRLVHERIVEPLHLTGTSVNQPAPLRAAVGYRDGEPVVPWGLHHMPGTGDIHSTADDLARFLTALHHGALLPEAAEASHHALVVPAGSLQLQTGPVVLRAYGLGHFRGTVNGQTAYLHPGDNPGHRSLAAWIPETDTLVVALSNDDDSDLDTAVAEAM